MEGVSSAGIMTLQPPKHNLETRHVGSIFCHHPSQRWDDFEQNTARESSAMAVPSGNPL